ncbi:MAG TPA: TIGR02147 family protein [Bdellovibrionota bacterium]|nr:TIGR02147 family protein [Bdellovibrionota bacterium]
MQRVDPRTVFEFGDYRSFLAHHAVTKKAAQPAWSLGAWAKALDLKATASLTRVLKGDRQPGPEISAKLTRYFKFNEAEKAYFENLVLLDKVGEDSALRVLVMEKLQSLHPKRQFQPLDHDKFLAMSNWYFFAIREMTRQASFKEDAKWIADRLLFKVMPRQIKEAITLMLELGMLKRDAKSGELVHPGGTIDWKADVAGEASKRNHEQNLENAKLALRALPVSEREFTSMCLTISSRRMERAKGLIREFRTKFTDLMEEAEWQGDVTCQLQIQFFPFTRIPPEKKKKEN